MNGITPRLTADLSMRVYEAVRQWSHLTPDHIALVDSFGQLTYRQLDVAVAATRSWLSGVGVRSGDRVIVVAENCNAFPVLFFALTEIGAWAVPVNARLSATEVDAIRRHCGSRRSVYISGASISAKEHAERDGAAFEQFSELGTIGIGALDDQVVPERVEDDPAKAVAALIYTSGTTGKPKGVMLTHRNLVFAAATSAQMRLLTPDDRLLGVLPMSHVTGLSIQLLGSLLSGATLYLLSRFDPMNVRAALKKHRITVMFGVPFMYTQFLEYAKIRRIDALHLPDLRLMSSSGAPLLPSVKVAVQKLFCVPLQNGFGVSECSPNISITRVGVPCPDASAGQVYPGVEVKIMGRDQKEVPQGEVGEVWVRGPNVMKGYYRAAEETAKAINAEGWFNTQDLARFENANIFVVGRTKELIIRFGFNVYPVEVESVLNMFPGVVRSAVIGRSDKETGEQEIVAFVQLEADRATTTAELAEFAAQHLAPYKRPTEIRFVSEMPVTLSGKVRKDRLEHSLTNELTSLKTAG